jgi:hypothetical protein
MSEAPPAFFLSVMNCSDSQREGFIDLTTVVKMMKLTPGQRLKLAGLVAADRTLGGLRADGTMPLDVAIKFCQAAKNR